MEVRGQRSDVRGQISFSKAKKIHAAWRGAAWLGLVKYFAPFGGMTRIRFKGFPPFKR
jgi:hypothetical protein